MKLDREFYMREDTIAIARELLGKLVVVPDADGRRVSAMIVETEAYLGIADKAAHSFGARRTPRTEVMYAEGGYVYVFFVYGMYYQLNVVAGPKDHPHAILIRGAEPVEGIEIMRIRRGERTADKELTSGPGKLAIALGIDKTFNGEHFGGDRIWLEGHRRIPDAETSSGKRIGIDYAEEFVEKPWRFWVSGNPFVSKNGGRTGSARNAKMTKN